jgi:hypothetical protein
MMMKSITETYASEFRAEKNLWNRAVAQKDQAQNTYDWFEERIEWLNFVFRK